MKKILKYTLILTATALSIVLAHLIFKANANRRRLVTCAGLKVKIKDRYNFVTPEEIKNHIDRYYGTYIGKRLDSINLVKIEKILDDKSAVLKSEAYTTSDGILHISITQREPIVRLHNDNGGSFYSDERGFIFPLQRNYTSPVPIVDGKLPLNIPNGYKGPPKDKKEKKWLSEIISLINYMEAHGNWAENISQIHVAGNGDLIMFTREGKEQFIFGPPNEIKAKFKRMEAYYQHIVPEKGDSYYNIVNVKYRNRIICRK